MHFSGIIIGPDPKGQMARYSEDLEVEPYMDECYECCGEARHQPCDECDNTGKAMTTRNPEGHWDYWRVGGRWAGYLRLLPGREGTAAPLLGDWDSPKDQDMSGRADQALAGDVDWEATLAASEGHRTYFMVAEGVWKERQQYHPDSEPHFTDTPGYEHLWDSLTRNVSADTLVTIMDIHR
jgi:hypothetical protein